MIAILVVNSDEPSHKLVFGCSCKDFGRVKLVSSEHTSKKVAKAQQMRQKALPNVSFAKYEPVL